MTCIVIELRKKSIYYVFAIAKLLLLTNSSIFFLGRAKFYSTLESARNWQTAEFQQFQGRLAQLGQVIEKLYTIHIQHMIMLSSLTFVKNTVT